MLVITAVATDTRAVGAAAALAIGGTVALDALFTGGAMKVHDRAQSRIPEPVPWASLISPAKLSYRPPSRLSFR